MKKLLLTFFLLASVSMFAAPEITVFGQIRHSFSAYGLNVNAFHLKKDFSDADAQKVINSIRNSKMIAVAETAAVVNAIFSNTAIKNALTEFFKNGGTFYIWVPSWSWMNNQPKRMYGYFNYYKVYLPLGYKGFGKGKTSVCKVVNTAAGTLDLPAGLELQTAGANNRPLRGDWKLLMTAEDNSPAVMMQEKVFDNGRVIVSYIPMLHDKKSAPFIDNMVRYAYGDLLKK